MAKAPAVDISNWYPGKKLMGYSCGNRNALVAKHEVNETPTKLIYSI